jgi:hypothetical protein
MNLDPYPTNKPESRFPERDHPGIYESPHEPNVWIQRGGSGLRQHLFQMGLGEAPGAA